jgi:peptide/nickel transport system substrate-binding protein
MGRKLSQTVSALALFGALAAYPAVSQAADLKLGLMAPATTLDPHFTNAGQNLALAENFFDTLVRTDSDGKFIPGLAASWRIVDDATWEFKLRDTAFSDGTPLTAEDVVWSIERPATIASSTASLTIYTKAIVGKEIVDDHTLRLKTKGPYPLLLPDLSNIAIVSKKATQGLLTEDFRTGKGVVGTGPYQLVSYDPENRVVMKANEHFWGGKPDWDNVEIRFLPNDSARLSALLSGNVDAIENVPSSDIASLRENTNFTIGEKTSYRFVFLFLDSGRETTPGVTANDGSPLKSNPLSDVKVRQAINLAIDRDAISTRLMENLALPTANIVLKTMDGYLDTIAPTYDPKRAKELLAEAGYPDGFHLNLIATNNRLMNDAKVSQAIAQMLTRVGIRTTLDSVPFSVITTRYSKGDVSSAMMSWPVPTSEASFPFRALIACPDKERGWGLVNWGHYCNPELDTTMAKALTLMDQGARTKVLEDGVRMIGADMPIVPLYFQISTWAARKGISIAARSDERTSARLFTPAP